MTAIMTTRETTPVILVTMKCQRKELCRLTRTVKARMMTGNCPVEKLLAFAFEYYLRPTLVGSTLSLAHFVFGPFCLCLNLVSSQQFCDVIHWDMFIADYLLHPLQEVMLILYLKDVGGDAHPAT